MRPYSLANDHHFVVDQGLKVGRRGGRGPVRNISRPLSKMARKTRNDPTTDKHSVPDIVIITGLSGSGMSSATNAFQDLGYFCVDNLPITMLQTFARLVAADEEKGINRAALVIDIREGEFLADFEKQLDALRALGLQVG